MIFVKRKRFDVSFAKIHRMVFTVSNYDYAINQLVCNLLKERGNEVSLSSNLRRCVIKHLVRQKNVR